MRGQTRYIIGGGNEGRERLRLLARVMLPSTRALLDRVGVQDGMTCLDAGCGGGDVTLELASRVGATGRVVGLDMDEVKLDLARSEAAAAGAANVEYRHGDINDTRLAETFDLVYARFLLTHLPDPAAACRSLARALRPGGVLVVADIDHTASLCYPPHPAYARYLEVYTATARAHGSDPDIGPRLPGLLQGAGLEGIRVTASQCLGRQPDGDEGDVKRVSPVTLERIADAAIAGGLASAEEIARLLTQLDEIAADETFLIGLPRVVEAWGQRPARFRRR